jgi:hypothetical protein
MVLKRTDEQTGNGTETNFKWEMAKRGSEFTVSTRNEWAGTIFTLSHILDTLIFNHNFTLFRFINSLKGYFVFHRGSGFCSRKSRYE